MGWFDNLMARLGRRRHEPSRETIQWPNLVQIGRINNINNLVYKATPRNLRYFSRTPYPRRAINSIKNPIKMLDWEVCPIEGADWNSELKRQAQLVTECLQHPNEADDFQSLLEQMLEDYLLGACAVETQLGGSSSFPLRMWPVDGLSIQMHSNWDGQPNKPRYAQTVGYGSEFGGGEVVQLLDKELLYLRPNPNTATPFGFGPLEIAFNAIARLLSVSEFAGNIAGNQRPSIGIEMPGFSRAELEAMRSYWRNDVEGQGQVPFFGGKSIDGKTPSMKVLQLHPEGDNALYLKYQELLHRELACAFDLSPQNFGIERDINRNTSEVSEDRDWDQAIKPCAHDVAKILTRHCIRGLLGFSQLRFRFVGLDREDEMATNQIYEIQYKNNIITPNEWRDRFGLDPSDNEWGDRTFADVEIAISAARGTKQVLDGELPLKPADIKAPIPAPGTVKPKPKPKKGK